MNLPVFASSFGISLRRQGHRGFYNFNIYMYIYIYSIFISNPDLKNNCWSVWVKFFSCYDWSHWESSHQIQVSLHEACSQQLSVPFITPVWSPSSKFLPTTWWFIIAELPMYAEWSTYLLRKQHWNIYYPLVLFHMHTRTLLLSHMYR